MMFPQFLKTVTPRQSYSFQQCAQIYITLLFVLARQYPCNSYTTYSPSRKMLKLHEVDDSEEPIEPYQNQRNRGVLEIRREQREETFTKRRRMDGWCSGQKERNTCQDCGGGEYEPNQEETTEERKLCEVKIIIIDPRFTEEIYQIASQTFTPDMIQDLVTCIQTCQNILLGVMGLRRIVSSSEDPPLQEIIDTGVVPLLLDLVKQTEFPQVQLESIWTLTNIAAGSNQECSSIVEHEGIPVLMEVLDSESIPLVEQAIWALGNIATDNVVYRDTILEMGMIGKLSEMIFSNQEKYESIIEEVSWVISNLLRSRVPPEFSKIQEGLNMLCVFFSLDKIKKENNVSDCLWAISTHCTFISTNHKQFQFILDTFLIDKLVPLLMETQSVPIFMPGFRLITQISAGSDKFTSRMLKCGVLDLLQSLLKSKKKEIRRQTCWTLSNLSAGNQQHVVSILKHKELIDRLLALFQGDSIDVKKEICYVFANMVHGGKHITSLPEIFLNLNIIEHYINLLEQADCDELISQVLDTLDHLLRLGEQVKRRKRTAYNDFVLKLYQNGGVDVLQRLQEDGNEEVYSKLAIMIPMYFQIENPLEMRL